jgi:hypothetical protein
MSLQIENEFEILHISHRSGKSEHPGDETGPEYDYRWFSYNLVFRAIGKDFKDLCLMETRDFKETRIYTDHDLHEKYVHNLRAYDGDTGKYLFDRDEEERESDTRKFIPIDIRNTLGIKSEDVYVHGYETVFNPILIYIEKFDVFRFWGYFMDTPATQGITSTIYNLSKGINGTRVTDAHMLITCLRTLDYFWD